MNAGELVELFRSEMTSHSLGVLRDAELYRYIDEGYRQFVRLTGGVVDMASDITELDVEAGEPEIDMNPLILRVLKATMRSNQRELKIINYTDLQSVVSVDYGKSAKVSLTTKGVPRYFMVGAKPNVARLIHIPEAADTIDLIVERMPLGKITGPKSELKEIDDWHHLAMLDWMKARTYQRPGSEIYNLKLGETFAQRFSTYCNEARRDKDKRSSKVRVVSYGG